MSDPFAPSSPAPAAHPIGLTITDDYTRSRLTVFFRLIIVIPHVIWLYIYGLAFSVVYVIAWFAALFTASVPGGLHRFLAGYISYSTRISAYVLLLTDPFPPFSGTAPYPVTVRIDPPQPQSRVTVFFRFFLAIPALILVNAFGSVYFYVAFMGWFFVLVKGRMPETMTRLSAWLYRYQLQTNTYLCLLTERYPDLSDAPAL